MIDLTPIINAAILLVAALVTTFLVPWIKANTDEKQREELLLWARVAVNAAEQLYQGSGRGEDKKAYVLAFLEKKGYTANPDEIEAVIESLVLGLKG